MTTEEQLQSSDIQQVNGADGVHGDEHDNETSTSTSSAPPVRRSRFFRSKRKQREAHDDDETAHTSNETVDSSESPEQPIEETSPSKISTTDTEHAVESTKPKRSPSPERPSSASSTDEPDASTVLQSANDIDAERQAYLAKKTTHEKLKLAEPRSSVPTIYSGYTRKKSQSVKLTRIDPLDPVQKKNVRFADDFGLDLSQIKVIKSDELPHVPSAAFKDLHVSEDEKTNIYQEKMKIITYLEQRFENPLHSHGFEDRVSRHKVVLEQANAIDNRIYGTVKVVSFGLNKRVRIRLTTDNWNTSDDYDSTYITDSYDGTNDRFSFTMEIPRERIHVGNNIQFCVGYESYVGPEYWDNNYQQNYRFECISRSIPDYSG